MDDTIYIYIRLKYFKEMLFNNDWVLLHTSTWDDKFENFYLKNNRELLSSKAPNLYGQCWTLRGKKCADAMWRLHSGISNGYTIKNDELDETAVKIHTKVSKLRDAICEDSTNEATAYIGIVNYKSKKCIQDWIDRHKQLDNNAIIDSLFIKRNAFSYEKEARIIIITNSDKGEQLRLKIDPFALIEGNCVLDPRLDDSQYKKVVSELKSFGIKDKNIRKSTLYDDYKI